MLPIVRKIKLQHGFNLAYKYEAKRHEPRAAKTVACYLRKVLIMASKTFLLCAAVCLAAMAALQTQAQLLGLGKMNVSGVVHCSTGPVTSTTPVFPNASVQMQCGDNVVSTTTTNSNGEFSISLSFVTQLLSAVLSDCKLVVTTPLSTCDASLPTSGLLQSGLQLADGGGLIGNLLGLILNLVPTLFSLIPSI